MQRASRLALIAALVGLLGAAGGAQQAPPPQGNPPPPDNAQPQPADQRPTFRSDVNFVRVDAIVTDKTGKPVDDLKPEDFEVTEEGKPQKIETFKLISLDGGLMDVDAPPRAIRSDADEEREAARDDVRLFAIFLDDYHVRRENSISARGQLSRFIQTQLGPSDMIAIMGPLDPLSAVRHTRNHDAVMQGIQQFVGRKYDYEARTEAEARWMAVASAEQVERMRNEISFSAIKALILRMGGLKEGRKALILVSEGYSNTLPPQARDPIATAPGFMNPQRDDPNAGDSNAEFRREAFTGLDMGVYLREIYDLANRHNVSIYPVDPRGLAAAEFGVDRNVGMRTDSQFLRTTIETLQVLAENSDGRAIVSQNDLLPGLKQIVVDSSAYYLLGYASNISTPDGKFHAIDVKVKRPGLQVRHRRGFWALKADDAARLAAPVKLVPPSRVESALAANIVPRNRLVRTWIGTSKGENGKTRVTLVWEPMPRVPGQPASRASEHPVRLSVSAAGPDGTPHFHGAVPPVPAPAGSTAGAQVSFEAPPGPMQLRLAVEGADAEVLDSEIRELTVPDLTVPQLTLGTPQVFRGRTLPELQRLKSDPAATPTAAREFSRTDRLFIRVPTYGPSAGAPKLAARLLNREGQVMSEVPVTPAAAPEGTPTIELGLANLAAGEYGIEITAAGDAGQASEVVAFRVGN